MPTNAQQLFDDAMMLVEKDRPEIAKTIRSFPVTWNDDPGNFAQWNRETRSFIINSSLMTEPIDLADVLVHEGTHAQDDLAGKLINYGTNWGINEIHAFEEASRYWIEKFPNGKPEVDPFDKQLNEQVVMYRNGTLWDWVHRIYSPVGRMLNSIFAGR